MIVTCIKHLDALKIQDEVTGAFYYGCDQEWYAHKLQRLSGCGPTTSTTILRYLYITRRRATPPLLTKGACLHCMENVWKYVTPGPRGIPTTQKLCDGLNAFAAAKSLSLQIDVLDIPRKQDKRPPFVRVLTFLDNALARDIPIAFLNLHNGEESTLDAWHWVTIVSVEHEPDGSDAFVEILDEGQRKRIHFSVWFQTTALGGGLVAFDFT